MTQQRKPSDQKLKEKAILGYGKVKEGYGKEAANFFKVGYEEGGKFARDFDPWFYVEDGEFPDEGDMTEDEEGFFIHPNDFLITSKSGHKLIAEYMINKHSPHGAVNFFTDKHNEVIELDEVKCFMPIPLPQK